MAPRTVAAAEVIDIEKKRLMKVVLFVLLLSERLCCDF